MSGAVLIAVEALRAGSADTSGDSRTFLGAAGLEVAILDVHRPRRAFRRITGSALHAVLAAQQESDPV